MYDDWEANEIAVASQLGDLDKGGFTHTSSPFQYEFNQVYEPLILEDFVTGKTRFDLQHIMFVFLSAVSSKLIIFSYI